jgi:hypothetical protein
MLHDGRGMFKLKFLPTICIGDKFLRAEHVLWAKGRARTAWELKTKKSFPKMRSTVLFTYHYCMLEALDREKTTER